VVVSSSDGGKTEGSWLLGHPLSPERSQHPAPPLLALRAISLCGDAGHSLPPHASHPAALSSAIQHRTM
jgi:hypothetical protein